MCATVHHYLTKQAEKIYIYIYDDWDDDHASCRHMVIYPLLSTDQLAGRMLKDNFQQYLFDVFGVDQIFGIRIRVVLYSCVASLSRPASLLSGRHGSNWASNK
jgi:hypothetical protein